jgi:hypothetical protein
MACFHSKNPTLGKFWSDLQRKILVYFMAIWSILHTAIWYIWWPFGIFHGCMIYFSRFGMLYQEKSGIPGFENP